MHVAGPNASRSYHYGGKCVKQHFFMVLKINYELNA